MTRLSPRLREIVEALPLTDGMRVIEIGCGPGAAAREVAQRVGPSGHVLAIDRPAPEVYDDAVCPENLSSGAGWVTRSRTPLARAP